MTIRRVRALLFIFGLICSGGLTDCMLTRPQSGPAFRYVDEHLVPDNRTAQYWLLPVFIPVGILAAITDAAIIHPITIIDDTAVETHEALWGNLRWDEAYMTESAVLPWRTAATPLLFAGGVVVRVLFEIPHHPTPEESPERLEEDRQTLAQARTLLDTGKPSDALRLLTEEHKPRWNRSEEDLQEYILLVFRAAMEAGRYEVFEEYMRGPYYTVTGTPEFKAMLDTLAKSESPLARSVALGWWADQGKTPERDPLDVLHLMLNDESEAIRAQGLARIQPWLFQDGAPNLGLSADLRRIAESDASVFNREKAAAVLRQLTDQALNRGPKF